MKNTTLTRRQTLAALAGATAATLAGARQQDAAQSAIAPPGVGASQAGSASGAYYACALQFRVDAVNRDTTVDAARARMRASIARLDQQIKGAKSWIGADLKLVVLPEYTLTSFPTRESIPEWLAKAVLTIDGPEYDALSGIAQQQSIYLAGSSYEADPKFPGIFFQCAWVIDPTGKTILRYRRLISTLVPTPHDVWDAYLDAYGIDGVFPVARTPLGVLAAIASEEILYPEIARCHAVRGAELFVHSSSEAYTTTMPPKRIGRLARAMENLAWVVSANTAGVANIDIPIDSANGGSEIINHLGSTLVAAGQGETMTANARVDLLGLREYRRRSGISNMLSRLPYDVFQAGIAGLEFRRKNGLWRDGKVVVPARSYFREQQAETLARLIANGVIS
ncbi:MAG TPA: nitrilase-related carbon-nitrogen hydrolase [Steroidobacteraceae bacterium]|nr:nitrilase-related carbon-nitrogen hydrolase [Steroidobacteraceae bacterium]HRX88133.1 nitrilase-related carbon-nitrogen hydrolase [Steroidobacteraceae bacterium]